MKELRIIVRLMIAARHSIRLRCIWSFEFGHLKEAIELGLCDLEKSPEQLEGRVPHLVCESLPIQQNQCLQTVYGRTSQHIVFSK